MKSSFLLVLAGLMISPACAATQATLPRPVVAEDHSGAYAAAVTEAFANYEREIQAAASLTYASYDEAEAVMRTLSANHFDWQLKQSLARRGLTLRGLAELAERDAAFFHAQQRLHWGELEQLQGKVASIATRVQVPTADEALFASDMSK
jgi:hypothetical protein